MVEIMIYADNRVGLLSDVSRILAEQKIDVHTINSRTDKRQKVTLSLSFEVQDKEALKSLLEKLNQVNSVIDIVRTRG